MEIKLKPNHYMIEVLIIGETANFHRTIKTKKLDLFFNHFDTRYHISRENLFHKKPGLFRKAWDLFKGVKARYLIVYWEGQEIPLNTSPATVSPKILETVRTSRALGKAIKELFKTDLLSGRGIIFVIIAFLAVAVFILRMQGTI